MSEETEKKILEVLNGLSSKIDGLNKTISDLRIDLKGVMAYITGQKRGQH